LWLDDGHKIYEKTETKLSVKVFYTATKKEGEGGVGNPGRGTYSAKLTSLDRNNGEAEYCLLSFLFNICLYVLKGLLWHNKIDLSAKSSHF